MPIRSWILTLLAALCLVGAGCSSLKSPEAKINKDVYSRGTLRSIEETPLELAVEGAADTFESMRMPVIVKQCDEETGLVKARTLEDKTVTVKFSRVTHTVTGMRIRVGWFGDQEYSEKIQRAILKKSGAE